MTTRSARYALALLGIVPWSRGIAQNLATAPDTIPGTVVSFTMAHVPAGKGAAAPFWIGQTEVTWDMFEVFVYRLDGATQPPGGVEAVSRPSKPYVIPGAQFGHQGFPALSMSYAGAEAFARWLSVKTGRRYRLPTEAEWEAACSAGAATTQATLGARAWYWDTAEDRTHRTGSAQQDGIGLYDMLGNVAEWVMGRDGVPVIKGGSFQDEAKDVDCAARRAQTPAWRASDPQLPKSKWWLPDAPFVGFRLVRDQ